MARTPKVAVPPGFDGKGCSKCGRLLLFVDPSTGQSNFSSNGYCKECKAATNRAEREQRKAVVEARTAAQYTPEQITQNNTLPSFDVRVGRALEALGSSLAIAHSFPDVDDIELPPRCACCWKPPTQEVHAQMFCDRCAYYVSACGCCLDHGNREHIAALVGRPQPPLLPAPYSKRQPGVSYASTEE